MGAGRLKSVTGGPRRRQASKGKDLSKSSSLAGLAAGKQNFHTQTCACWWARAPVGTGRLNSVTAGGPRRPQASKGKYLSKSSSLAGLAAGKQNFHTQTYPCWWARGKDLSKSSSLAGMAAGKENFHKRRKAQISNCWRAQAPASKPGQRAFQIKLAGRPGKQNFHLQTWAPVSAGRLKSGTAGGPRRQQASKGKDLSTSSSLDGLAAGKQNFHAQACACWQARAPMSTGRLKSGTAGGPWRQQASKSKDLSKSSLCL